MVIGFETLVNGKFKKDQFLEAIHKQFLDDRIQFYSQLEFTLRSEELPYYGSNVGNSIKNKLKLNSIKIYDKTFRLLYSSEPTKEVFQSELRHDESIISPGEGRKLITGDNAYRSIDGNFYFVFPFPYTPRPLLINPNLEYGFNYWLFDKDTGSIYFTNDIHLLTGDKEPKELLDLFKDKNNQEISWKIDGENGILHRIDTKEYSVYLIEYSNFFSKQNISKFILISFLTFVVFCFFKLIFEIRKKNGISISHSNRIGVICFLMLLVFYTGVTSLLPDFRYYKDWTKMRWSQSEFLLEKLEKNILDQISSSDTQEEIYNKNFDPIVKEIYFWKNSDSTSLLINRFSIEIHSFLVKINELETSQLLESNSEYIFIIPIRNAGEKKSYVILVLDPQLFAAKKSKDKDEFYFINSRYRLSDDRSKERFQIHPKHWEKTILNAASHLYSGITNFSLLGVPFQTYFYSSEIKNAAITNGLFVFKADNTSPILVYISFFTFIPFLFLNFYSKFLSNRKRQMISEITVLENIAPSLTSNEVSIDTVKDDEKIVTSFFEENPPPEEAIAETPIPIEIGEVLVKKNIHQYLPPSLWKSALSPIPKEIQQKRDSIFNLELKSLVNQVTTSDVSIGRRQSDLKKESPVWNIPEEKKFEYSMLDRVYRGDEVSLDGIVEYTKNFIQRLGSPRFSFLFLNDTIGSYHSQISFGLDYNTRSNLIFLYNDPFLQFNENGFASVDITEKVKLDKFISKKFSWEILAQIETILAFNLEKFGFPGLFLILLDKQEKEKFVESHKRMIGEKLKHIVPALHVLMEKEDKTPDLFEDSLSWMVRSFLQATLGGKRNAYVTHILWENYHPTDANEEKKAEMLHQVTKIVESKDRVIENSPNAFLLISEKDLKEPLEKLLKLYPFPYDAKYMKYPDDGENYYLYL
ncbi:MAG: hypothetical protein SH817_17180 [Leptospira sp.]|nr:hypothetical protein [Leptospira sp.]